MSNCNTVPDGKDPLLWEIAQKRANFKKQAVSYVIINMFLWALWYATGNRFSGLEGYQVPWPVWTTIGWGVGLVWQFSAAYVFHREHSTEREYEKLITKPSSNK